MAGHDSPTMLIDGSWLTSASKFEVVDPATLEVIGVAADGRAGDATEALDAACAAFASWSVVDPETRGYFLRRASERIRERVEALASLLCTEAGKPLAEARNEVLSCARTLEWSAEEARRAYGRITEAGATRPGLVMKAPVGPVLAITPWNFPASMMVRKVALALAAGCTVIVKPAEQTPLIATAILRVINETGLPTGVLQSITTSRPSEVCQTLLDDPPLMQDQLYRVY